MASDNLRQLLTQFSNDGRAIVSRVSIKMRIVPFFSLKPTK